MKSIEKHPHILYLCFINITLSIPNWLFSKQVCVIFLICHNPDQACALCVVCWDSLDALVITLQKATGVYLWQNALYKCIMTVEWARTLTHQGILLLLYYFVCRFSLILLYFPQSEEN
jgi:hypothetical protein